MKDIYRDAIGAIALTFGLAACIPSARAPASVPSAPVARPASTSAPTPAPAPAPPPPPVQAPASNSWMDAPATPGTWRYEINAGGPVAVFVGLQGQGEFVISCNRPGGEVGFWRAGQSLSPQIMTIRAETATRSLQVAQAEDTNPYLTTRIAGSDPLLDAMALSKGRFAVEIAGLPPLYLPAWAEVTRVIEDCR